MCPYNAISMKYDNQESTIDDLGLSKAKILPKIENAANNKESRRFVLFWRK